MRSIFRLTLTVALWAPSLGSVAHALQTARTEAAHPLWTQAEASGSLRTSRSHNHHDEKGCSQCPRPPQASVSAATAFGARPRPLSTQAGIAQSATINALSGSASSRAPPASVSA